MALALFAAEGAHAEISLGSTTYAGSVNLLPGQKEMVDVSFFNTGEEDITLYIEQATPVESSSSGPDLYAYVMQKTETTFTIDPYITLPPGLATTSPEPGKGKSWIAIGGKGDLYVPATKIYFSVQVPAKQTFARNTYSLLFRATTQNPDDVTGMAAPIGQVREFPITVHIEGVIPNGNSDRHVVEEEPEEPLSNDNYINPNIPETADRNANNPDFDYPGTEDKSIGTTTEGAGNLLSGLAAADALSPASAYNLATLMIILIGSFALYRIWGQK